MVVVVVVVVRGGLASMMMMMMATMARRRLRLPLLLSSNQSIIMGGGGDTKRTQKRTHTPFIIDTLNSENPKHKKKGRGKELKRKDDYTQRETLFERHTHVRVVKVSSARVYVVFTFCFSVRMKNRRRRRRDYSFVDDAQQQQQTTFVFGRRVLGGREEGNYYDDFEEDADAMMFDHHRRFPNPRKRTTTMTTTLTMLERIQKTRTKDVLRLVFSRSTTSASAGAGFVSIERNSEEEKSDRKMTEEEEELECDAREEGLQYSLAKKSESNNTSPRPFCRFCLEEETKSSKLISPCDCKGSQQFVHVNCLNRWQLLSLKNGCDRNGEVCSVCKKKFDKPKDPFWKRVAKYVYVHLHKRRWFYGYAFFSWLKMSVDLVQCSDDQLPLVTIIVTSLAHLVDADTRYKRIIGLMNQDTTALSILQLELSVYFNRSLFWASNDSSDLAKCVEAFGFMLAWPTTALVLLGGWSMNLNGDIWGWVRAIKGFANESKFAGISKKTALSIALANFMVLFAK